LRKRLTGVIHLKKFAGIFLHKMLPLSFAYYFLRKNGSDGSFGGEVRQRLGYDRSDLLVTLVDKVAVRDYCGALAPNIALPKLYQVASQAEELDPSLWPDEFVVKPSHGCGAVVIVSREPRAGLSYEIDTKKFRWDEGAWGMLSGEFDVSVLAGLARHWLGSNYEYWTYKTPEWAYRHVPRNVVVEELIVGPQGEFPIEARFHCFHGRVALGRVTDVLGKEEISITLDRDGRLLDAWLTSDKTRIPRPFTPPALWGEAVRLAEQVARDIDYLRVDLFITEDRIVLSELTPYPNGGGVDFVPPELSRWLAQLWRDPSSPEKYGSPPVRVIEFPQGTDEKFL
jgi:hypothetical protein